MPNDTPTLCRKRHPWWTEHKHGPTCNRKQGHPGWCTSRWEPLAGNQHIAREEWELDGQNLRCVRNVRRLVRPKPPRDDYK